MSSIYDIDIDNMYVKIDKEEFTQNYDKMVNDLVEYIVEEKIDKDIVNDEINPSLRLSPINKENHDEINPSLRLSPINKENEDEINPSLRLSPINKENEENYDDTFSANIENQINNNFIKRENTVNYNSKQISKKIKEFCESNDINIEDFTEDDNIEDLVINILKENQNFKLKINELIERKYYILEENNILYYKNNILHNEIEELKKDKNKLNTTLEVQLKLVNNKLNNLEKQTNKTNKILKQKIQRYKMVEEMSLKNKERYESNMKFHLNTNNIFKNENQYKKIKDSYNSYQKYRNDIEINDEFKLYNTLDKIKEIYSKEINRQKMNVSFFTHQYENYFNKFSQSKGLLKEFFERFPNSVKIYVKLDNNIRSLVGYKPLIKKYKLDDGRFVDSSELTIFNI